MSAAAQDIWIQPRHLAYRDALTALASMTEHELQALVVEMLPQDIRDRLRRGPHGTRFPCAVCDAFTQSLGAAWVKNEANWNPDDPVFAVFAYHEVPKAKITHENGLWYGEHANEIYRRCIATYRAAGWDGEASEPNA